MYAVRFIEDFGRICSHYDHCSECPLRDKSCEMIGVSPEEAKEIVAIVEKWVEEHPEMKAASGDLISRQAAIDALKNWYNGMIISSYRGLEKVIKTLPSAEPEIVMCKECKHRGEKPIADGRYWCNIHGTFMYYCSDAERRTDG